jgi:hypothetical protein
VEAAAGSHIFFFFAADYLSPRNSFFVFCFNLFLVASFLVTPFGFAAALTVVTGSYYVWVG